MIQMLLRASNVVGYSTYPDNVIKKFIKVSSDHGVDIYRIFDSMNSVSYTHLDVYKRQIIRCEKVINHLVMSLCGEK